MAGGRGVAKTEVSALYSFSGGSGGHLQVEAKWNRVSSILETPPLDCSVTLEIEVGEEEEAGELQLLEGFVRGLKGEGVTWVAGPESRMENMLEIDGSCVKPIREMDKDGWKVSLDYRIGCKGCFLKYA